MTERPLIEKSEPDGYGKGKNQKVNRRGRTPGSKNKQRFENIYVIHSIITSSPFQILQIIHATNNEAVAKHHCENFSAHTYTKTQIYRV